MSLKENIIKFLKDKKEVELKEIYANFPDIRKENIRAVLNSNIKKGLLFERVGKGKYKLKL